MREMPPPAEYIRQCQDVFKERTGLEDVVDDAFDDAYARRLPPEAAVRLALHHRPLAKVKDGELKCPVCKVVGGIVEFDSAIRMNRLHVVGDVIHAATGDATFETDKHACEHCGVEVRLPSEITEWY